MTAKNKTIPVGTDGKPMTSWQIWLNRLCIVLFVWAGLELLLGIVLIVAAGYLPSDILKDLGEIGSAIDVYSFVSLLGVSAMIGAVINIVVALLGQRGAKNPCKIALFFWIVVIDAVVTAWALASTISQGVIDPSSLVSGLFIIALAVCAWKVRSQTGYFDQHP
ncbi:MAG: hypothetical protein RR547_02165 [Raoultibacter sp.]